jgi:hypothetical protein
MMFLSSFTLCDTSFFTRSVQRIFPILPQDHFRTFKLFRICFSKCPAFNTMQSHAPNLAFNQFIPYVWVQISGAIFDVCLSGLQRVESRVRLQKRFETDRSGPYNIHLPFTKKKYIHNNKLGHYTFCTNCKLLRHCLSQLNFYSSWNYYP